MSSDPEFARFKLGCLAVAMLAALSGCAQAPATPPAGAAAAVAQRKADQLKPNQRCPQPVWPADLARSFPHGYRSSTGLRFLIGPDGEVRDAMIARSSGFKSLDQAAESALRLCHFKPALKDGKPAEAWHPVEYVWTID